MNATPSEELDNLTVLASGEYEEVNFLIEDEDDDMQRDEDEEDDMEGDENEDDDEKEDELEDDASETLSDDSDNNEEHEFDYSKKFADLSIQQQMQLKFHDVPFETPYLLGASAEQVENETSTHDSCKSPSIDLGASVDGTSSRSRGRGPSVELQTPIDPTNRLCITPIGERRMTRQIEKSKAKWFDALLIGTHINVATSESACGPMPLNATSPAIALEEKVENLLENLGVSYNCYKIGGLEYEGVELIDMLMDDMLKFTIRDVDLPVKEGIIVNRLGSNVAMANMINNLAVGVAHSTVLYGEIGMELGWHYKNSWNHRWTILKQVYFYNLWRRTVTVATFIVVIRTVLQTVLAILEKTTLTK
ncbi:Uncharacterized protein TCM_005665 [Theobroma cacao]|uniref:Uncharacterized protein n=1 Tax=Theobroma cacao TaxID=3641 RepID=A0A061DVH9_THECC|nr:Uncharacterized protein TCM_005665 [Theobroma cacao]